MVAPLAMLTILLPLLGACRGLAATKRHSRPGVLAPLAGVAFVLAAGGCSLLALANAPVGPTAYSPALTGLRPLSPTASTLVLAPRACSRDQHGVPVPRLGAARRARLHRGGRGPAVRRRRPGSAS